MILGGSLLAIGSLSLCLAAIGAWSGRHETFSDGIFSFPAAVFFHFLRFRTATCSVVDTSLVD